MFDRFLIRPDQVKRESEAQILARGGKICDWLPFIDHTAVRSRDEVVGRMAVMTALINIHFEAPVEIVSSWIGRNGVADALSASERAILEKCHHDDQELTNLFWYIEALWALMWAGRMINDLPFDRTVEDSMAPMLPILQENEDTAKLGAVQLRSYKELYRMRDLYYRVHWYARDGNLRRYDTSPVSLDVVMERRKALEWVMDRTAEWDEVDLST